MSPLKTDICPWNKNIDEETCNLQLIKVSCGDS